MNFFSIIFLISFFFHVEAYAPTPKQKTEQVCFAVSKEGVVYSGPNGEYYDLSPLAKLDGSGWEVKSKEDKYIYYINPCQALTKIPDVTDKSASIYQYDTKSKVGKNLGKLGHIERVDEKTLALSFTGGEECSDKKARFTQITLFCDPSAKEDNPPANEESKDIESAHCEYNFIWRTPFACPLTASDSGSGSSGGSGKKKPSGIAIFFIVILSLLLAYIVGGFLINRFYFGAMGYEQLPQFEFWANCMDACYTKCRSLCKRRPMRDFRYTGIRADDGHTQSLIGDDDYSDDDDEDDDHLLTA